MKYLTYFLLLGLTLGSGHSQSIRYPFHEMGQEERDAYIAAYDQIIASGLHEELAVFHNEYADPIHIEEWPEDQFLPWHRRALLELEIALQQANPRVSVPWWDETDLSQTILPDPWDPNEPYSAIWNYNLWENIAIN